MAAFSVFRLLDKLIDYSVIRGYTVVLSPTKVDDRSEKKGTQSNSGVAMTHSAHVLSREGPLGNLK